MREPKHPNLHTAALLAIALACVSASADEPAKPLSPEDFAYRQTLQVPDGSDGALVRFTLIPSIYHSLTRADLGDLRVFNAQGQALPYSILQPTSPDIPAAALPVHWFPLPVPAPGQDMQHLLLQVEQQNARVSLSTNAALPGPTEGGAYLVDLSATAVDGTSAALDSLTLDWIPTAGGLNQSVTAYSSDDLTHWGFIGTTRIVQLDYLGQTLRQNRLDMHGVHARYLRLAWQPDQTPPVLTAVQVRPWKPSLQPAQRLAMSIPRDLSSTDGDYGYDAGNPIGADSVQLDLPRGSLIIATVLVRDDPAQPWRTAATGNFFHVMQGAVEMINPPLGLGDTVHARYWLVRADPRSSSLQVPPANLDLAWTPEQVVFLAQPPGPYELAFGNPRVAPASLPPATLVPGFDQGAEAILARTTLAQIAGSDTTVVEIPHAGTAAPVPVAAADVALKPVNPSALLPPAPTPPWRDWKTWLAWSALLLGVGLLGWMALRLVRQMREPL